MITLKKINSLLKDLFLLIKLSFIFIILFFILLCNDKFINKQYNKCKSILISKYYYYKNKKDINSIINIHRKYDIEFLNEENFIIYNKKKPIMIITYLKKIKNIF